MITRRKFLKGFAALAIAATGLGGFALAEPFRLNITRYRIRPPRWPERLKLRLAVLADLHACEPWMGEERIRRVVARTNALNPDAILLLGDYVAGRHLSHIGRPLDHAAWSRLLGGLRAPLGVHAVLGNHDWWHEPLAQRTRRGPTRARLALEQQGVQVYENDAIALEKDGERFWIAGLGDQWAFFPAMRQRGRRASETPGMGVDDLPATLGRITDDAPIVLMAHEPEIFPRVPPHVALTLSGHTHGGQVRLFGYSPIVPSRFGQKYAYGHVVELDRTGETPREKNLVVSGGLGVSGIPLRLGVPPEIVVVELG